MSQGVAINKWRAKEEYGSVPNSTRHEDTHLETVLTGGIFEAIAKLLVI